MTHWLILFSSSKTLREWLKISVRNNCWQISDWCCSISSMMLHGQWKSRRKLCKKRTPDNGKKILFPCFINSLDAKPTKWMPRIYWLRKFIPNSIVCKSHSFFFPVVRVKSHTNYASPSPINKVNYLEFFFFSLYKELTHTIHIPH